MPALSSSELTLLRTKPHKVEWYLAVAPYGDPCFTAQVNDPGGSLDRGSMTIPYDNDTGEGNVKAGMTLWVGSSPGGYDKGKVRIRSIDTANNTISVAENSEIEWADDLYLTVPGKAGFREIWAKYQRIVESGGTVTFYKDYDIAYSCLLYTSPSPRD